MNQIPRRFFYKIIMQIRFYVPIKSCFGGVLVAGIFATFFMTGYFCPGFSREISKNMSDLSDQQLFCVHTDKAIYLPGDTVHFQISSGKLESGMTAAIRYRHLDSLVAGQELPVTRDETFSWEWLPPVADYRGYLVEVAVESGRDPVMHEEIAVDVSSDWSRFPRYGFVSQYPEMKRSAIDSVIFNLNRFHINGLQFYDWHYKHHQPLKGSAERPDSTWNDIANRTNHLKTIQDYISSAHNRNMETMAYNLIYGSWDGAEKDGISDDWRIYLDAGLQKPFMLDFSEDWSADIFMMDPSNPDWQRYIFREMAKVFKALPFDGWHVDQVGDWGKIWNGQSKPVALDETFGPFLDSAKASLGVRLVMNAVNQYGQSSIAAAPVDFLYTEVWDPDSNYNDLVKIVDENRQLSYGDLNSVIAAYVNQGLVERPAQANSAAVIYSDAVLFAAGASHIELGEHLLAHPYYPNSNLSMPPALEQRLLKYYDFLVAYENLLRDDVVPDTVAVTSPGEIPLKNIPEPGAVWVIGRKKAEAQILHFINFEGASILEWRDNDGRQTPPVLLENLKVELKTERTVRHIWLASPDFESLVPIKIQFDQKDGSLYFELPRLQYWNMIVID